MGKCGNNKQCKGCDHRVVVLKDRKKGKTPNEHVIVLKEGKQVACPKDRHIVIVKDKEEEKGAKDRQVTVVGDVKQPAHSNRSGFVVKVRTEFDFELSKEFFGNCDQRGTCFNVKYLSDGSGKKVAVKWVKSSHNCNFPSHMEHLISAAETTAEVLSSFGDHIDMRGWTIRVVKTLVPGGDKEIGIEPFVKNVEKFTSNTFWETDSNRTYRKLVLALVHYSYVCSRGKWMLSNIRGGVDEDERVITLLPPTIVSRKRGRNGCGDLGNAQRFGMYHVCNSICCDMPNVCGGRKEREKSGGADMPSGVFEIVEE